jgi:hypothetical protein
MKRFGKAALGGGIQENPAGDIMDLQTSCGAAFKPSRRIEPYPGDGRVS